MSQQLGKYRNANGKGYILLIALLVAVAALGALAYGWASKGKAGSAGTEPHVGKPQELKQVQTVQEPKDAYDLIVVGTDPEGVAAAVSGARNGLKTLLIDGRDREVLGGLMTLGWLNSLDMNYAPDRGLLQSREILNQGLFTEWYAKIEGDSFDVTTAANAFNDMVAKESNIDVVLMAKKMEPVVDNSGGEAVITGLAVTLADGSERTISAKAVIDATQDADIAAAAGVPYTYGREDLGDKQARMAVTLVFRLKNVTPDVWKKMQQRAWNDNDDGTGANEMSIWGYKDMKDYPPANKERVAMRGLNVGRQNNNTILINALQIFGIDGTDPASRAEAFELAKKELPLIVQYMKDKYPELSGVELDATAPELYVRETRHIQGEYRLTMIDVLENRDQWDRIAFGSYPVDIQRLSPADTGAVVSVPQQYAVPFRSIVPQKVDGLLVVGRSASFDTLPHGSARVIPVGMATAQAAGAAAKLAMDSGMTFREMSASKETIAKLQDTLNAQGMALKPFQLEPQPFMKHKSYEGLKAAVMLGLATGGYNNDFALDAKSNVQRMMNQLNGMRKAKPEVLAGDPSGAVPKGSSPQELAKQPIDLETAARMIALVFQEEAPQQGTLDKLLAKGIITQETTRLIANRQALTNGDTYLLIKDAYHAALGGK